MQRLIKPPLLATVAAATALVLLIPLCIPFADATIDSPVPVASVTDGQTHSNGQTFDELAGARAITTVKIGTSIYALVAAFDDHGVQIINITNPANPVPTASFDDGDRVTVDGTTKTFDELGSATFITTVKISSNTYALVAGGLDRGVQIVDITDPANPVPTASFDDGDTVTVDGTPKTFHELRDINGITIVTIGTSTYALATAGIDDGVQIVDITDPANPVPTASFDDGDTVTVNGTPKTFDELNGARAITTVTIDSSTYALVASGDDDGVQIINITNPANPVPTASFDDGDTVTVDGETKTFDELNGAWDITAVKIDTSIYALVASDDDHGVQIIEITNPANPIPTASFDDGDTVTVDGTPKTFDELRGAEGITTVKIGTSTYALVAAWNDDGVQIINITNPANPVPTASFDDGDTVPIAGATRTFDTLKRAYGITTVTIGSGTYALVAAEADHGVQIVDISARTIPGQTTPVIKLFGVNPHLMELGGANYTESGATCNDADGTDLTSKVIINSDSVNRLAVGEYQVTYDCAADDSGSDSSRADTMIRKVAVRDTVKPAFVVDEHDADYTTTINLGGIYVAGTILNVTDRDQFTQSTENAETVNTDSPGTYYVTYTVTDASGNSHTITETVIIFDPRPPAITLNGDNPYFVEWGSGYDEPGAVCIDGAGDDTLSPENLVINFTAPVDALTVGFYEVSYYCTDPDTNIHTGPVVRPVTVRDTVSPVIVDASMLGAGTIVLTYSEPVDVKSDATDGSGFGLSDGGGTVHFNSDPAGAANKITLGISGRNGSTADPPDITYDSESGGSVEDTNGNAAHTGTFDGTIDMAPPIPKSARTSNSTAIHIGLSEAVADAGVAPGDFALSVAPSAVTPVNATVHAGDDDNLHAAPHVTSVSVDGSRITLLLNGTLHGNQDVKVSYQKGGSIGTGTGSGGTINDLSGGTTLAGSVPIGQQADFPVAMTLSKDGTTIFVLDFFNSLHAYGLPAPWDTSGASHAYTTPLSSLIPPVPVNSTVTVNPETYMAGLTFSDDGTRLFATDALDGSVIHEFAFSSPWNASAESFSSYTAHSLSLSGIGPNTDLRGIDFSPDGTTMYIASDLNDQIHEFSLTDAWNASSAFPTPHSISAQGPRADAADVTAGIAFSADGSRMFVAVPDKNLINEFALSEAWNISSAAHAGSFSPGPSVFSVLPPGSLSFVDVELPFEPSDVAFSADGTSMFVLDESAGDDFPDSVSGLTPAVKGYALAPPAKPFDPGALPNQLGSFGLREVQNTLPVARAGPDVFAYTNTAVSLDGTGSYDANGDTLAYLWEQTGGPGNVALDDHTLQKPAFIAPAVADSGPPIVLEFTLTVSDETGNADRDTVAVTVLAGVGTPAIVSASVVSATQFEIVYNKAVHGNSTDYTNLVIDGRGQTVGVVAGTGTATHTVSYSPSDTTATTTTATDATGTVDIGAGITDAHVPDISLVPVVGQTLSDGVAPTLVSARTGPASNQIDVTFSEAVRSGASDDFVGWSVSLGDNNDNYNTVITVTGLDGTGSTATLTLQKPVMPSDATPDVTYDAAAGSVSDAAGNPLATATVTATAGHPAGLHIHLIGDAFLYHPYGEPYTDKGVLCHDADGNDITDTGDYETLPYLQQLNKTNVNLHKDTVLNFTHQSQNEYRPFDPQEVIYRCVTPLGSVEEGRTVALRDETPPEIRLNGPRDVDLEIGKTFDETATCTDAPLKYQRERLTGAFYLTFTISSLPDGYQDTAGEYTISYTCSDSKGNDAEDTSRTLHVGTPDNTPPVLAVNPGVVTTLENGTHTVRQDVGFAAAGDGGLQTAVSCTDNRDDTPAITLDPATVDTSSAGTHAVTYSCTDAAGNPSNTVTVTWDFGPAAPVLAVTPADTAVTLAINASYSIPTASCTDHKDGDITNTGILTAISSGGQSVDEIDTSSAGTYDITYSCSDSDGNTVEHNVTVTIRAATTDNTPPHIVLKSPPLTLFVPAGAAFADADPGAFCIDGQDGRTDEGIDVDATALDTAVLGNHTVTYSCTDSGGLRSDTISRPVSVYGFTVNGNIADFATDITTSDVYEPYAILDITNIKNASPSKKYYDTDGQDTAPFNGTTLQAGTWSVTYAVSGRDDVSNPINFAIEETITVATATAPPDDNVTPTARISAPATADEGTLVTLNGTGSTDTDGTISSYAWTTNDTSITITNPSQATASFTAPNVTKDTRLVITLDVTDNKNAPGSAQHTMTITNVNQLPDGTPDTTPPTFTVNGNAGDFATSLTEGQTYTEGTIGNIIEADSPPTDQGTRYYNGTGDAATIITAENEIDSINGTQPAVGSYTVQYSVSDSAVPPNTHTITETVTVGEASVIAPPPPPSPPPSNTPPTITLNGNSTVTVKESLPGEEDPLYDDPGATCTDSEDADAEGYPELKTGGDTVRTSVPGTYAITYYCLDSDGDRSETLTREVTVTEEKPKLALDGPNLVSLPIGASSDMINNINLNATCTDPQEGTINDRIEVQLLFGNQTSIDTVNDISDISDIRNQIKTDQRVTYEIEYSCTDRNDGRSAEPAIIKVEVGRSGGGGGSSGDVSAPSIRTGFDAGQYPLVYDGVKYGPDTIDSPHTATIRAGSGERLLSTLTVYENGGAQNVQHVDMFVAHDGRTIHNDGTETHVTYDSGNVRITDPHGLIASATVDASALDATKAQFEFAITFAKKVPLSDVLYRLWDTGRNALYIHLEDALVVSEGRKGGGGGSSGGSSSGSSSSSGGGGGGGGSSSSSTATPATGSGNGTTTTTTTTAGNGTAADTADKQQPQQQQPLQGFTAEQLDTLKQWGGFASQSASDSQLLAQFGIEGTSIPPYFKQTAKWFLDADDGGDGLTAQEFVAALSYLGQRGLLN